MGEARMASAQERQLAVAVAVVESSFEVELDPGKGCKTKAAVSVAPFRDTVVVDIAVVVTVGHTACFVGGTLSVPPLAIILRPAQHHPLNLYLVEYVQSVWTCL